MRVCFVVNLPGRAGGGAELQCYLIGKGLATKQWDVSFITLKEPPATKGPFKIYHAQSLVRGSHTIARVSRALQVFKLLRKIDPEIVIATYAGAISGFAALFCKLYKKVFVYRAASALDAMNFRAPWDTRGLVDRSLSRLAMSEADAIFANAEYVADEFKNRFPRKHIFAVRNGQKIALDARKRLRSHVLWMGRMEKIKNPSAFVALAKCLPNIHFVMVGSGSLNRQILDESSAVQNLSLINSITAKAKRELIKGAVVLVNTSFIEGFPNTLIEAGIFGTPFVSFVDPDEVICRYRLGFHVRSLSELAQKVTLLVKDPYLRRELGINIRRYVARAHDISETVATYDRLLRSIVG